MHLYVQNPWILEYGIDKHAQDYINLPSERFHFLQLRLNHSLRIAKISLFDHLQNARRGELSREHLVEIEILSSLDLA